MAGGPARRTERLMCLLFLIKARGSRGITRAELRDSIEDYAHCASEGAFERMLERDKSDLRDAGVLIDVIQRDNYHEDQAAYVLGSGTLLSMPASFDADELRILGLAADAWERGTWNAMAHGALRKLEVFTDVFPIETTPRISLRLDAHVESIRSAIREHRADALQRTVEPWGLLYRKGGWYCVGFDCDRQAARVFRTSRISGNVVLGEAAGRVPDPNWPAIVRSDATSGMTATCTLLIRPDHGWTWRQSGSVIGQRAVSGINYDVLVIELGDHESVIAALAAAAPEVLVATPEDMQARVLAHLDGVLHG
jgi:proteasome accessory factor B